RIKKVSFWQLADIIAPSLILGQAIGRWGNFMNQEAHGGPMSEAAYENFHQYLPAFIMNKMCIDGIMYYSTFLYESLLNIHIFIILILLRKNNTLDINLILSNVIIYSIGRFFIEGLRTDNLYFGPIRQEQLFLITLIVIAIVVMIVRRKMNIADRRYDGKKVPKKKAK